MADESSAEGTHILEEALLARMPFGRHKGQCLMDLPFNYLCWFAGVGWPPGRLGVQMATIYELQHNDLELLDQLKSIVRRD